MCTLATYGQQLKIIPYQAAVWDVEMLVFWPIDETNEIQWFAPPI